MASPPCRIATLYACGHWFLSVPATDELPADAFELYLVCVDLEDKGVFINSHVFTDDRCPKVECSEFVWDPPPTDYNDMQGVSSHEWSSTFPRPDVRRFAAAMLIECDQAWEKVRGASWDKRKYLAAALHNFDAYTAGVIESGDLVDNVLARYALRALTWIERAEQFWYDGRFYFYESCIAQADEHIENQRDLFRQFVAAVEETVDWHDNHWNPHVQAWLENIDASDEDEELKDVDDDSNSESVSGGDVDPFEYVLVGDGGFLDQQFRFHREQDSFDRVSYEPSSVSDDSDDDDLTSEHSVSVSEVLNLYNDQDIYGPPYHKEVGRLEPMHLDSDAQDLVDGFIADYAPEMNSFEELSSFQENVLPDDDDGRCRLHFGNGRLTNTKFTFGKNFEAIFGTNSLKEYHFTFRVASRKW